jgi:hypothetical protein
MPSQFTAARIVLLSIMLAALGVASVAAPLPASGATPLVPAATVSYYETSVDPATLMSQGESAGQSGAQGLVILDFGRPAVNATTPGTMDFDGTFDSLSSITAATVSYIEGYLASAPQNLQLHVAIGTNDSCGYGQPCGNGVCGCMWEPSSYANWGAQLAAAVEEAQQQVNVVKSQSGDTDTVTVVGGDDAEPAFDPGYQNTYDLLAGYADAVGGYQPSMVDYGSAEPGYWSMNQLLQVVDGFRPDIAVPEVYNEAQAASWTSLLSFAAGHDRTVSVFGVLTNTQSGDSSQDGYDSLLDAIQPITGQTTIHWLSAISQ